MRQDINMMDDRELLMELVEEKRRRDTFLMIRTVIYGALLLALVICAVRYLPPIIRTVKAISEDLNYIRSTINTIQPTLTDLEDKFSSFEIPEGLLEELKGLLDSLSGFTSLFH